MYLEMYKYMYIAIRVNKIYDGVRDTEILTSDWSKHNEKENK